MSCKYNECPYFEGVIQRDAKNLPHIVSCSASDKYLELVRRVEFDEETGELLQASFTRGTAVIVGNESSCPLENRQKTMNNIEKIEVN